MVLAGLEPLKEYIRGGGGLVVATAQTFGWSVAMQALAARLERSLVFATAGSRAVSAPHFGGPHPVEQAPGESETHEWSEEALAHLTEHVRFGGLVAAPLDADMGKESLPVRFLCEEWRVPRAPFELAAAVGAPLVTVFALRAGFLDYHLAVGDPIHLPRAADECRLRHAAQRSAWQLERYVRKNSGQRFCRAPPMVKDLRGRTTHYVGLFQDDRAGDHCHGQKAQDSGDR